jgi:hypothetical protein
LSNPKNLTQKLPNRKLFLLKINKLQSPKNSKNSIPSDSSKMS